MLPDERLPKLKSECLLCSDDVPLI